MLFLSLFIWISAKHMGVCVFIDTRIYACTILLSVFFLQMHHFLKIKEKINQTDKEGNIFTA